MLKNTNITARTADDIVNAIKSKAMGKTDKFEFCIVESFPEFERGKKRDDLPINWIKQFHSMHVCYDTLVFLKNHV